jgi:hypothetical protein
MASGTSQSLAGVLRERGMMRAAGPACSVKVSDAATNSIAWCVSITSEPKSNNPNGRFAIASS